MMKILTYINTVVLVAVVGGGAFAYFQRGKITDALLKQVQGQIPGLVKNAIPAAPSLPNATGPVQKPMVWTKP